MLKYILLSLLLIAFPSFSDSILARIEVPNRFIPQGEVFLRDRGTEVVVQSVFQTRFPGKVLQKITENERKNWPGNAEMESYLAVLEAAFAEYDHHATGSTLVIDYVAGPGIARVDFIFPPAPVWRSLPLSAAYIQKNQEHILTEAFGKKSEAIIAQLRTLNPLVESDGK